MANRVEFKGVKEEVQDSICKISDRESKPYLFADPDNVTGFKCSLGKSGEKPSYLFEFIQNAQLSLAPKTLTSDKPFFEP